MLKQYPHYFASESQWISNRDKTFFKSIEEVQKYQEWRLKFLSSYYGFDLLSVEPSMSLPGLITNNSAVEKKYRSGTTSIITDRVYYYSGEECEYADRHHIWKIEKSHQIQEPGTVIWICSKDYELVGGSQVKRIFGPSKDRGLGDNSVYELLYNHNFGRDEWRYNLDLMKKEFSVKYVRASPSVIEAIYYFGDSIKFDCPVMLSEETLNDRVRAMAESIFTSVIDKMVCWDGCLGWFECPHKVKHIYDEFCYVEELENGVLAATDLNNLACPFARYITGDRGRIGQIDCKCGISGNYFKSFEGKVIEALYVENDGGKLIPGRFLSEKLSVFFRTGREFAYENNEIGFDTNFVYKLKQRENMDVDFIYSSESHLNELQQQKIVSLLNKIIWQNKNCSAVNFIRKDPGEFFEKKTRRTKSLFIESDYVRNIWKQKRVGNDCSGVF